jgi:hypothetical protein
MGFVIMANPQPTIPLDIEALNFFAARLREQADAFKAVAEDKSATASNLELGANVCQRLASLRFEISEITSKCTDPDTARELRDALDDAAKEV